jgi:hypothetical protein
MTNLRKKKIAEALEILRALGFPRAQQNERSALCLLALVNLTVNKSWSEAECIPIGITPIMNWARNHYKKEYAPNTRETVRRQSMHQFVEAGLALYNPDQPDRSVNSPKAVYQIEPETLALLRTFETRSWKRKLSTYLAQRETLVARYAHEREQNRIPIKITDLKEISLSPGEHNELIKAIIEDFGPRFVPGGSLLYIGDTGEKWGYSDNKILSQLNIKLDLHGKMPDVIFFYPKNQWLFLVESVTSHGPVDGKRHEELARLFSNAKAGLVFVTAFPNRQVMSKYLVEIAWETEVWVADVPSHLIHFNGDRFLGPMGTESGKITSSFHGF